MGLRAYYRKFGGIKAFRFFVKRGLLWPMAKVVLSNPFRPRSYTNAYLVAVRDVEPLLLSRFSPVMVSLKTAYSSLSFDHKKSKIVWVCWLQGMDSAPLEIKRCYASLLNNLPDREVRLIDGNNWGEYVDLPNFIIQRWEKKQISPAHFTDLLRLQLLIRYGGTWIDATIFCTGITLQNESETLSFLDANLFMFQYTLPTGGQWGGIGNWFISACTNNEVLMVLRDMLFAYWEEFDFIVDYYIFHLFFSMLREVYPTEIAAMPYGYARRSLALVHHWGEQFDAEKWSRLTSKVCFHKLTYDVKKSVRRNQGNYYHHIMGGSYSA